MSFERFVSFVLRTWRIVYFKPKTAVVTCFLCFGIVLLVNSNMTVLYGYDVYDKNGTFVINICYEDPNIPETHYMGIWNWVHSILYSYLPFILLAIANILLIACLHKNNKSSVSRSETQERKHRSITITIISVTLLFIVLTGTGAVVNFFIADLIQTYTGNVVIVLGDTLCFSFHSLNIISLLITNKRFRDEFRCIFLLKTPGKITGKTASSIKQNQTERTV